MSSKAIISPGLIDNNFGGIEALLVTSMDSVDPPSRLRLKVPSGCNAQGHTMLQGLKVDNPSSNSEAVTTIFSPAF